MGIAAGASVPTLGVATCGARVRGRLRGGPSSLSDEGLVDLGGDLVDTEWDACSVIMLCATCGRSDDCL